MTDFGPKFLAAFRLLGSNFAGERESAAHAIHRLLGSEGILEFAEIIEKRLSGNKAEAPPPWEEPSGLRDKWMVVFDEIFTCDAFLSEWEEEFIRNVYSQLSTWSCVDLTPRRREVVERIYRKLFKKDLKL